MSFSYALGVIQAGLKKIYALNEVKQKNTSFWLDQILSVAVNISLKDCTRHSAHRFNQ